MTSRFDELMAKAQSGLLNPAEVEELAALFNAPLFGQPPAGFNSKHALTAGDVAGRLRAIDWFARCGGPLTLDLTMGVEAVGSWAEAIVCCRDGGWQDVELAAQNQLTLWLDGHDRANYQRWNELVERHKADVIAPLTEGVLLPFQQRHGLDIVFIHSVQWDILGALMENSYLGSGHPCLFFLELLWVYEAGHFPCGWDGRWPEGKLRVY
jgi:hypothetical protein